MRYGERGPNHGAPPKVTVALLVLVLLALSIPVAAEASALAASKIAPAIAPAGTGIAVTGDRLLETTDVTFLGTEGVEDDVAADSFVVVDPKKLVAQIPPGARTGPLAVTSPAGTVVTPVPAVIVERPGITAVSAQALAPGATLRITGTDLLGVKKTEVLFGAKKAAPLATSTSTALDVLVPNGVRGGPTALSVTTEGGTAFEDFSIAPAVKSIAPAAGTTAGGTTVTIVGSGFTGVAAFPDDPDTAEDESRNGLTIGGERVAKLIAVSDTEIVAVTPPGVTGPAPVVVSTSGGGVTASSTSPVTFAYQPLPVVTGLSRDWNAVSPPGEPAPVTATGTNLTADTRVMVGSVLATDVTADTTAGTLTFTPPPGPKPAIGKLTFGNTASGVTYSQTLAFNYAGPPGVAKLAPLTGPAGTVVSITGTGFVSGTTVTIGGAPATCTAVTSVLLRCTTPEGSGAADVVVTNGVGSSNPGLASVFTYAAGTPGPPPPAPQTTVSSFAPTYGTTGSTIALKGTNLNLVSKVEFTGAEAAWVDAPKFVTVSATRIVVTVPAGAATGVLRLTTPAGRVTSGILSYTSSVRPSVSSIDVVGDATYGVAAGDMILIRGAGLLVGTIKPVVTVGGKPATLLLRPVPTAKTIVVRAPASVGGREQVTVTTPLGAATAEASVYFTPQVRGVKPLSYTRTGGTPFTISGTGFTGVDKLEESAGGRLAGVTLGGVPVSKLVVMSDKEVVATTASGSATVDLLLARTQHGSWIGSSDEQVRATNLPVPTVTGVSPNVAVLGMTPSPVTITGTNLRETSTVQFGTTNAVVQGASEDGTSMVIVPPARATAATVGVTVTNIVLGEELTTTLAGAFRYLPQPAITNVSPSAGFTGVTPATVTITGANLRMNSVVRFGDTVAAVESVSVDGDEMTVTPPLRNDAGSVDIRVTNIVDDEELTATVAGGYTYQLRAYPTVSEIAPATAVAGASTSPVTITGTNLRADSSVRFGTVAGTVESASEDGTTIVVTPPVAAAGTVNVTVTNTIAGDELSVTVPNGFRYLPTPTITSASPDSGTVGVAQASATITGTNLLANSVVRFGGVAAAIQSVAPNGTSLVVTPPTLGTPGPVDVTVTNIVDGESLTATLTSGYTYLSSNSPTISAVSPSTGTTSVGNADVTITGTKLRADTVVKFGTATATVVSAAGDENSMVVTPPVSASDGHVAVSVTNVVSGQNLTSALANGYRYLPQPSITNISPSTGLTGAIPPVVTITGQNLRLNSVVRFGNSSATIESAVPGGTSMVVTPPLSNTVGAVDVTVTNIVDGTQQLTATGTGGYQYNLTAASVTGLSAGTALPGTQITLTGTSFSGVTAVKFGDTNATFSAPSATTLYATVPVTPSGAQGTTVDITVINGTGQVSTADPATANDWTWASHPFITAMSPTTGVQGSQATITGTGFTDATAVRFGSIDVTYTVVSDTTIQATVRVTPSAGSVADVVVVARGLTSPEPLTASINDWTWHPIAVITRMQANPASAGSTVTVTGRNFTNIRTMTVNGVDVSNTVVVSSSTGLTFTVPPRPGGGGANRTDKPVYITNGSGALSTSETDPSTGKPAHLFTWL